MKTRRSTGILAGMLGLLLITILTACEKTPYESTVPTNSEKLSRKWQVKDYLVNDAYNIDLMQGFTETYSKNGTYSYSLREDVGTGTWRFENDQKEIQLQITQRESVQSRRLHILKLEKDAFWYYYLDGTDRHEFHMIPGY